MNIPVADAHCDFLYNMWQSGHSIDRLQDNQAIYLPHMREGGVALQFFAAWVDRSLHTPYLQQCMGMIDAYHRMLNDHAEDFTPLTPAFEPGNGKIATVLTIEGGEAIEGSLAVLRMLKKLGVCAMTLTWNFNNELSGAATARGNKGLTDLGREVVEEMGRIHMAVDVSHLSDAGIDDVLSLSKEPVFASHSNARSAYYSPRSLQDAHIRAIARQGGVIGVNFFHKQLSGRNSANIEDIVRQIMHIVKIGGVNCCAIGSDFDGMPFYPQDLKTSRDLPKLLAALGRAGFTGAEIAQIAYYNLHDYILRFVCDC
ncbi:MAG TPA: dipeptidase [Feifaniaceae bacterium]|nr:dipeptidase [Feifaniaceae bacterium]